MDVLVERARREASSFTRSRLLADVHDARLADLAVLRIEARHDRLTDVRDTLLGEVTVRVVQALDTGLTDAADAKRAVRAVRVQGAALLTRAGLAVTEVTTLAERAVRVEVTLGWRDREAPTSVTALARRTVRVASTTTRCLALEVRARRRRRALRVVATVRPEQATPRDTLERVVTVRIIHT